MNVRVQRHHIVTTIAFARHTDVANHAANSPAGSQNAGALAPDFVQFEEKALVVCNGAKLVLVRLVFLQRPIRR